MPKHSKHVVWNQVEVRQIAEKIREILFVDGFSHLGCNSRLLLKTVRTAQEVIFSDDRQRHLPAWSAVGQKVVDELNGLPLLTADDLLVGPLPEVVVEGAEVLVEATQPVAGDVAAAQASQEALDAPEALDALSAQDEVAPEDEVWASDELQDALWRLVSGEPAPAEVQASESVELAPVTVVAPVVEAAPLPKAQPVSDTQASEDALAASLLKVMQRPEIAKAMEDMMVSAFAKALAQSNLPQPRKQRAKKTVNRPEPAAFAASAQHMAVDAVMSLGVMPGMPGMPLTSGFMSPPTGRRYS